MHGQAQTLTPRFERLLQSALETQVFSVSRPSELASAILSLSNFYMNQPGTRTPWSQKFTVPATLAYFMPLNYVRLARAFHEVQRFIHNDQISEIWDFGSGLGTTQWVLEDLEFLTPKPFFAQEVSQRAQVVHRDLANLYGGRWTAGQVPARKPATGSLAVFSYSFLEMQSQLPHLEDFDHWLILEPSTRDCGRALMQWRSTFLENGLMPLAPCTHSQPCPLLVHSNRDWCHHRTHFAAPEWWLKIEEHLPMRNRTLTYSYLLLSRTSVDQKWRGATRVIGDTLEERGKTRQMVCRGQDREFLSWLHKHGEAPNIPHGALIEDLGAPEIKGGELRVAHNVKWTV